jgi:uncharacterized protein
MTHDSPAHLVPVSSQRRVRWRNALGWTTELWVEPADDPELGWQWRASVGESDGPALFSSFPGVDRELHLIEGDGLVLTFPDEEIVLECGQSSRFAGETSVLGTPVSGTTRQLNVMWRRGELRVHLRPIDRSTTLDLDESEQAILYVVSGSLVLAGDDWSIEVGEAVVINGPTSLGIDLAPDSVAVVATLGSPVVATP